jgi:ATP-binding protein involved in chromosome partitioning
MAARYGLPFLGEIPLVQAVREAGDGGVPIVMHDDEPVSEAFATLASRLAQQIAVKNAGLDLPQEQLIS